MVELLLEKDLYRVPAGRAYFFLGGGPPQLFPNSPWCWPWPLFVALVTCWWDVAPWDLGSAALREAA